MKLFVKNNCAACKGVEAYFTSKDIPFEEVNIQEDYDAAFELVDAGIRSVPVLQRDGIFIVGSEQIRAQV